MTTLLPIEDRIAIHELQARYCRGLDTQRRAELLDTFWEDGVLHSSLAGGAFTGHSQIAQWYDRVHSEPGFAAFLWGQHRPANIIIDSAAPDTARVWSQFALLTRADGAPRISAYGEYRDLATKRGDEWRFSSRTIHLAANAHGPNDAE